MKSRLRRLPLSIAACSLAVTAVVCPLRAFADPDILNGSFEGPVLLPNSILAGNGGDFWTPSGSDVILVSNNFSSLGTTPYGNQYLGFSLTGASDQQTVSGFLAGQSYVLDFYFADIAGNANPQITLTISGAADAIGIFNAPVTGSNGANPYPFQHATVPFTTTADGDITFLFTDTGSASVALDNVSLSAVPEPSSIAMILLTATVAVGFCLRSAKQRIGEHRPQI
jgi:hypothetical protein